MTRVRGVTMGIITEVDWKTRYWKRVDKKLRDQHMGRIVFMDDEVTKNDNSRSGITKRMNQDF